MTHSLWRDLPPDTITLGMKFQYRNIGCKDPDYSSTAAGSDRGAPFGTLCGVGLVPLTVTEAIGPNGALSLQWV